jgi:hypothetical protein
LFKENGVVDGGGICGLLQNARNLPDANVVGFRSRGSH